MQLVSQHETCKKVLTDKTLYEWMCFESEDIVRHNWTDVAVHDRKIVDEMLPGDTRLWILWELGSLFLPMYCGVHDKTHYEDGHRLSSVELYMLRSMKEDQLAQAQVRHLMDAKTSCKYYFITKGTNEFNSLICPTTFHAVMDLVFCGRANHFL